MTVTIIAAIGQNGTLGANNTLIWDLPADMKHFVRSTRGHAVIMGRRTFESLNSKPLPKRQNLVITRQGDFNGNGSTVVNSIEQALLLCKGDDRPFIIGGAEIYKLAMPYCDEMYITHIHHNFENGDAFFPNIDPTEWVIKEEVHHAKDEMHLYSFTITTYVRRS